MSHVKTLLMLLAMSFLVGQSAFANLLISPQRLFFEPRERMQEMILMNNGQEETSYRIEWVELLQTETGDYEPIDPLDADPVVKKASEFIRFSPRQVKLKPGESQRIKFVVRRSSNINAGEYRSHIKFQALPRQAIEKHAQGEVAFDLQVLTSFVVPIIMREGIGQASFEIESVNITKNATGSAQYGNIIVEWSRRGAFGAVGKLSAYYKAQGSSKFKEVGQLNGVNFFAERESLKSLLLWPNAPDSKDGILKILFEDEYTQKGKVLAQRDFEVRLP